MQIGKCAQCQIMLTVDNKHPSVRPGNILKIRCPRCSIVTEFKVPAERIAKPAQEQPPQEQAFEGISQEVAWLVVHDEETFAQTFSLKLGKNIIGRYSPDKPGDVMIKTNDLFMSRNHSLLEVIKRPDDSLLFMISDIATTNGTFINAGRSLSKYDKLIIKDGDTIQLGRTKVVLKTRPSTQNAQAATDIVKLEAYTDTVNF